VLHPILPRRFSGAYFLSIICLALAACGGGGSGGAPAGGGGGGATPTMVSGIAAIGTPLASAAVTLKDQNGVSKLATTDANGAFSIDITGLMRPFLLKVVSSGGTTTLFSAASSGGTANIHPFTDLAVQAYYQALGTTASGAFAGASSSTLLPSQTDLGNLATALNNVLGPGLQKVGVSNAGAFNIFSTPFTANGNGFDLLVHNASITGLTFHIVTGTLTQDVTVTAGSGTISLASTASDSGTSSSSSSNVAIATTQQQQSDQEAAVASVQALWTNLATAVSSKGSSLSAADMTAFVDASYLDRGTTATAFRQNLADFFRQSGVSLQSVGPVYNFTDANNQTLISARAILQLGGRNVTFGGINDSDDGRTGWVYIKESDGSFKLFGDQSIAYMNLFVASSVNYTSAGASATTNTMDIHAHAPFAMPPSNNLGIGTVSDVTVANTGANSLLPACGGGQPFPLNQSASMTLSEQQSGGVAVTDNGDEVFQDSVCLGHFPVANTPPAGTTYDVTFTPAGGGAANTITAQMHSQSSETANLATINGQDAATFLTGKHVANVTGTQLALTWALPTTFATENVQISTGVSDVTGNGEDTSTELGPIATSGSTITIPATLSSGHATTQIHIGLSFFGVNGERLEARFSIQ